MAGTIKRVVITGVTRGLGRAMLQEFAARGHVVAGCGRSEAAIEKLRRAFPAPHRFATVDVADDMQVVQWARHVLMTLGPPDILINNAAITNAPAPLWEIPAAEFGSRVDVKIKGPANVVRHFVPAPSLGRRNFGGSSGKTGGKTDENEKVANPCGMRLSRF